MTNNFVSSPAWIADADPIESWRTLMCTVHNFCAARTDHLVVPAEDLISFDTCASGDSIPDGCSTPSFLVTNMSTTGSKDTTSVKGTTTTTATTAVKATTDVNGTSGRQGATGSVSGNDETPAPSSCAKVILRQDSCASCSCAPPLPVIAVPALLFLCRLFLRRLFLHCSCTPIRTPPVPTTDACSKIRRSPT